MSYTSLWVIDKNWSGKTHTEYHNSHLFPPIVWNILMCKYIAPHERIKYDRKPHAQYLVWAMCSGDHNVCCSLLNDRINKCDVQHDRVLWELSNLSVFNAKDKEFVAGCIEKFVESNFGNSEYKDCEHIKERFFEIAKDIRLLPSGCKYFVIKGTSCDDAVEWWFNQHRLSFWDRVVCEFTLIENGKVVGFSDNLAMCKGKGAMDESKRIF